MTNLTTPQLIDLLGSSDASRRRQAALALGVSRDTAAVPALIEALAAERHPSVREDLTWATVQLIDAALPHVLAMLSSPEPRDRRTGAHVLSKVGDPAHFEALAPLVSDAHADVAIKAYRAVANTGRSEAADALATRLGDGDALQRDALTAALHRIGEAAVPALIPALADPDAEVREHAADALGHLGSPTADAATPALAALAADAVAGVRLAAVAALGQLGPDADAPLGAIASGSDPVLAPVAARLLAQRPTEPNAG